MQFPRASGVLLHPTSLPGPHGSGDLGSSAYHFVDWLVAGGQSLWQMLPLGGVGLGNSPYMSSSAFAGNPLLIDLADLHRQGWLDADALAPVPGLSDQAVNFEPMIAFRMRVLASAAAGFEARASAADRQDFAVFCRQHAAWLDDYALFMALQAEHPDQAWNHWAQPLARREPAALARARLAQAGAYRFWQFCQWVFFRQWRGFKDYANARGVRIVGDIPIFIAHQSAEVWARPELFELDEAGCPTVVAGVPPDGFSATGQRWGNPLYRWPAHESEHYRWWIARIQSTCALVDLVRLDHFRGFESCWEIPASEPTAMNGRWAAAPGDELLHAAARALGALPIIAEDLGVITPAVDGLRQRHGLPGMRVLQFAFSPEQDAGSRYLPHQYTADSVVYTGTHDNDTSLGWWQTLPEATRQHVRDYLACDGHDIAWSLIHAACASVAGMAIYPMQDVLGLPGQHRMNRPGVGEGNWTWRFQWDQVGPEPAQRLRQLTQRYGRLGRLGLPTESANAAR